MIWTFAILGLFGLSADEEQKPTPTATTTVPAPVKDAPSPARSSAEKKPVIQPALRPYKIRLYLSFVPAERFSENQRADIRERINALADRYLGDAWQLQIDPMPIGMSVQRPPSPTEMKAKRAGFDKLMLLQLGDNLSEWKGALADIPVVARELDYEFDSWGPAAKDVFAADRRLANRVFDLLHRQFRVRAEVNAADKEGKVPLTLVGLALQPRNSDYPLAVAGMPIKVYRDFISGKDKKVTRTEIPFTFLIYRQPEEGGLLARCDVVTALKNPLTMRTRRRVQMPGIGAGATESTATDVRFVMGPEMVPVTGYEVAIRAQDSKATVNLGNTDHRGRIAVDRSALGAFGGPTDAVRTVQVLLVAGQTVVASFPMVPGEKEFRQVSVRIDPMVAEVNGRVMALQDSVVDVVARRAVLQKRLDIHTKKNNLEMAKKVAAQINALPDRAAFEKRVADIRSWAESQAKAANRKLGSPINMLLLQTEKNVIANNFEKEKVEVKEEITVIERRRPGEEPTTPPAGETKKSQ